MADPLDLLSLDDGKAAINMDSSNVEHNDELARHITAISRIIDDACGPVVIRTITNEVHHIGPDALAVYLDQQPVQSVTTVSEFTGGTTTVLSAVAFGAVTSGYYAGGRTGVLSRRRSGEPYAWPAGGAVQVTYVAGRYADTASVDPRFADAAAAILRRLWKREAGAWAQSSTFFEDGDSQLGSGFFRVARPIIEEMLAGEIQDRMPGIA